MKAGIKSKDGSDWSNFYTVEGFRNRGLEVVNMLSEYVAVSQARTRSHVLNSEAPLDRLNYWKSRINSELKAVDGTLFSEDFLTELLQRSNHLHDPRYAGHQVAVPLPELAWLQAATALLNNGMAIDEMGPASSPMEEAVMQSVAQFMGFGEEAGGILTHGGTLANLTALLAARQRKSEGNPWRDGATRPCALLVSEQAHYCVDRAARVMGWGAEGIIQVPTDSAHRIIQSELVAAHEAAVNKGLEVIAVVGNACTTSTGTFDDLVMLADFAEAQDLWFHVDGAHGAGQVFSEKHRGVLKGMERADSVAMDFHKMLGIPALCTGLFYRKGSDAYSAFNQEAHYLYESEDEEWWNLSKRTFECTKRMLSAAVFGIWEAHGPRLWESLVDRLIDRAKVAAAEIERRPRWELFATPQSNIVCFRLIDRDNSALRARLIEQGPHYIVKTVLDGQTWLRCTFQNPLTTDEDIFGLLDTLESLG